MARNGNLIETPADEFNDPLQAILSNTEAALLVLSSSNPDIDKIKAALADMVSEVGRVTQMIRGCNEALPGQRIPSEPISKLPVLAPRVPSAVRAGRGH